MSGHVLHSACQPGVLLAGEVVLLGIVDQRGAQTWAIFTFRLGTHEKRSCIEKVITYHTVAYSVEQIQEHLRVVLVPLLCLTLPLGNAENISACRPETEDNTNLPAGNVLHHGEKLYQMGTW